MNTMTPISKSSIIHDTNHDDKTITIAQPRVPITNETRFDQLHLTTIIHTEHRKIRVGIPCHPTQFIDKYQLANKAVTKALVIEYQLPAVETNIRSAFRLPLSSLHDVKAKMRCDKQEFYTSRDFKIKGISFAGIGLVVRKNIGNKAPNPLLNIKSGTSLTFGIILVSF
ncbi:MAG: hypothetical protein HUN05_12960 [Desulfobacter sp.]|nr:MAG: hypothetical protein HUN05_12960 [Desulfobacter sp.]